MQMHDTQREEALGKTYDLALLRRLWRYVRPYRAQFVLALVCLPLTSAFLLAQPYLLKLAVDRYIAQNDMHGLAVAGLLFAGALVGVGLMVNEGAGARKRAIPFGPFLALGGVIGLWFGDDMVQWYLDEFFPSD